MIEKNYTFKDINSILTKFGFKKFLSQKCILENLLSIFTKILYLRNFKKNKVIILSSIFIFQIIPLLNYVVPFVLSKKFFINI